MTHAEAGTRTFPTFFFRTAKRLPSSPTGPDGSALLRWTTADCSGAAGFGGSASGSDSDSDCVPSESCCKSYTKRACSGGRQVM